MKRLICIFTFSAFFVTGRLIFAQPPAALNPPLASAVDQARVGVVAAVRGAVDIKDGRKVGRVVGSGAPVYLGDTVTTDAGGQLQILLMDQTVFTIGPSSSILIDTFIYDPATDDGKVSAQILKGTFRFITGKIAKKKPENMAVRLPVGTIGVRGTMVAGRVDGEKSMAVLLGPGPQNQMGVPAGSFVLNNTINDQIQSVHVTAINFGSEIAGIGQPPIPPFRVPDSVIEGLCNAFGAPPPVFGALGPPGSQTGPPTGPGVPPPSPEAFAAMAQMFGFPLPPPGEFFDPSSLPAPPDPRVFLPAPFQQLPPPPDIATTFEELRSLNNGPFHYENFGPIGPGGVLTTRPGVTFNFEANINLSFDVFGGPAGAGSKITSATTDIGSFEFPLASTCPTCNYNPSAFSGPAGFFYTNINNAIPGGGGVCTGCAADVAVGVANVNGDVTVGAGITQLAVVGVLLNVTIKDAPNGNVLAQMAAPGTLAERQQGAADGVDN